MTLVNLNLRLQRHPETPEGLLLQYVSGGAQKTSNPRELTLSALRAFYLALAYQSANQYSQEELQSIGLQCCNLLEQQILLIRTTLNLPHSVPMTVGKAPSVPSEVASSEPLPAKPVGSKEAKAFHESITGSWG